MRGENLGRPWQQWEDDVLRELYPSKGGMACSEALGRSRSACQARAARIGLHANRRAGNSGKWTPDEDRLLVTKLAEVCRATRRTPIAVCRRIEYLSRKAKERDRPRA